MPAQQAHDKDKYDFLCVWDLNGTLDDIGSEKAANLMERAQQVFTAEGLGKIGFMIATGAILSDQRGPLPEVTRLFNNHPAILGIKEVPSGPYTPNPVHPEGDVAVLGPLAQCAHKILIDDRPDKTGSKCLFVSQTLGSDLRAKPSIITYTNEMHPEQIFEHLCFLAITQKTRVSAQKVQPELCWA